MRTQKENLRKEGELLALDIVQRFNDPSLPLSTNDFRKLIFRALSDAYNHKDDTTVRADEVSTMYYLWEILDDIDAFNYLRGLD